MDADEPTGGTSGTDHIDLSIPARAEFLSLARLAAGVVGARADLGLDDVEDLRLGVEELCLFLVGPSGNAPGRLALRYGWDGERIEITCSLGSDAPGGAASDEGNAPINALHPGDSDDRGVQQELSTQILDALVDEHGASHEGDVHRAWLTMRRNRSHAH